MSKKTICHIGPGDDMPGGMLSVIKGYMKSEYLMQYNHIHLVSVTVKNKIQQFIISYCELKRLIKSKEIDIVHVHMSERGSCLRAIFFTSLCKTYGIPVIIHSHGGEIEKWYTSINLVIRCLFNRSMNKASSVLVLTPGWIDFWKNIVNEKKIYVVPNYVSVGAYKEKKYLLNNMLNILFMGQIGDKKGTFDLVKAVRILIEKGQMVSLRICGDGERERCDELICELHLEDMVKTLGWIDGIQKKYELEIADCLVLPSRHESFGIALLEGMANQMPCICGDGGYSKEIIEEGVDGFVVEAGNPESIANALLKLNSLSALKTMGDAAYINVKEKYSEDVVIKSLINVYEELS